MRKVAVLIPCLNEELTVGRVVRNFRAELPGASIHVFDNASTDGTSREALRAGAAVATEGCRGKGYVVQAMFQQVEADVYVLVDGDGTYPAAEVHALLEPILRGDADMVVGSRLRASGSEFRRLNRVGNRLFACVVNALFRARVTDVLSGFRAIRRSLVRGVALSSGGFAIESELTIKALEHGYRVVEVPTVLHARPAGCPSKLRRFRDGLCILGTILTLAGAYRPLTLFGVSGLALLLTGVGAGVAAVAPVTGSPAWPLVVLAGGLSLSGMLAVSVGLVLNALNHRLRELASLLHRTTPIRHDAGWRSHVRQLTGPAANRLRQSPP